LRDEAGLPTLCQRQILGQGGVDIDPVNAVSTLEPASSTWAERTAYELGDTDLSED
jgi:hypothetical protein